MDPLARGQRWWRGRKARRSREAARRLDPAAADDAVAELADLAGGADAAARMAVDGLEAVARSPEDVPARAAATDALLEVLRGPDRDPDLAAAAARSLRYVAIGRPALAGRLDEPYAAVLADSRHGARRAVAVDAGMVLSRAEGAGPAMPATREALREAVVGGPGPGREAAAVAYVVAADAPEAFEHHGSIAEALAIVAGAAEEPIPPADSTARGLAEGRTVADAVDAFREAADPDGSG